MAAILFAALPAIYMMLTKQIAEGMLVFFAAYGSFVLFVWIWSRTVSVHSVMMAVTDHPAALATRFLSQILVPSLVGWFLAVIM